MIVKHLFKPMILIVGPLPPPYGGVATAVLNLLNSDLQKTFKLIHLSTYTKRPNSKKGKLDILNILAFLKQLVKLILIIILTWPKVVQIETSLGVSFLKNSFFIISSKIAKRKIILSVYGDIHGKSFENLYCQLPRISQKYIKFILNLCDKVKVESQKRKNFFMEKLKLSESNIWVIPNAVYLDKISKNYNNSKPELLFVGWIDKNKGIFDLLKSIEILKRQGYNFRTKILGSEGRRGELKRVMNYIKDKNINDVVEIFRERPHHEIKQFYSSADIYLLPSYFEGLPYTILEAMAYGLPIISTKVGAIPEVIEEGINGFLIKPGNVGALTEKIEILIKDRILREKIGKNNREKIEKEYSMDKQVEKYKKIYNTLLPRLS